MNFKLVSFFYIYSY